MSPKRMSFVEDIAYSSLKDDSFKNISELKFNEQWWTKKYWKYTTIVTKLE